MESHRKKWSPIRNRQLAVNPIGRHQKKLEAHRTDWRQRCLQVPVGLHSTMYQAAGLECMRLDLHNLHFWPSWRAHNISTQKLYNTNQSICKYLHQVISSGYEPNYRQINPQGRSSVPFASLEAAHQPSRQTLTKSLFQ